MFLTSALTLLLLPFALMAEDTPVPDRVEKARVEEPALASGPMSRRAPDWATIAAPTQVPISRQVRIERRVILRINPQPARSRNNLLAELPRQAVPSRLIERPMGRCVAASGIVGVSDQGSRLIMYMRDRSMISAQLEKSCRPRDFYLGFYVERSDDGQLCVDRDRLMSRAGAKCRISEFNRLVAATPRD